MESSPSSGPDADEMQQNLQTFFFDSLGFLSDSKIFVHIMIVWIVSVLFCWKVFPLFHSLSKPKENVGQTGQKDSKKNLENFEDDDHIDDYEGDITMMKPPTIGSSVRKSTKAGSIRRPITAAEGASPCLPSPINDSRKKSPKKSFLLQLELEICGKAKEAGKHPSYSALVLSLIHNYNVDINKTVLSNNYSIFHCACLSCNLELVTSLTPLADLSSVTGQGDSPLYLAVYAASHRLRSLAGSAEAGLQIVRHLLSLGCDVNKSNQAGWTPLHQASRLGHERMVRLLLDSGAEMKSGRDTSLMMNSTNLMNSSIISRCSSIVTRSMSKKKSNVELEGLDKSFVNRFV